MPIRPALALLVVLAVAGCSSSDGRSATVTTTTTTSTAPTTTSSTEAGSSAVTLDPSHDYGNRYADGVLPVGDGKYTTDAASAGSVFLCHAGGPDAGGAQAKGPWFSDDGTTYDIDEKIAVAGAVDWDGSMTNTVVGDTRTIVTNDVPGDHTTGVFPVAADDPAYSFDRNPNRIKEQSLTYTLNAEPAIDDAPHCIGGEIGVMTTGVALFDAFDAGLRDAGAWEVQDGCQGHPQMSGEYHYHSLSSCITDTSVHTVIGYALDGFPITGPLVTDGNVLTTSDLDVCHGITGDVTVDGKTVTTYHYVMTQDFPYSASCFRSTPANPPGQP